MFEDKIVEFRKTINKSMREFFGDDFDLKKLKENNTLFAIKYSTIYGCNFEELRFDEIKPEHRDDFAYYRTSNYFIKMLNKLDELESLNKGDLVSN